MLKFQSLASVLIALGAIGCDSIKGAQPGTTDVQLCIQQRAAGDLAVTWGFKNAVVLSPEVKSSKRVGDRFELEALAPIKTSGPIVGESIQSHRFRVHLEKMSEGYKCLGVEKL